MFWFVLFLVVFFFVLLSSFFFFCLCFLEWEPLKSCLYFSLGVLLVSFYFSFGVHVWYSYFIVLVFLSGVLSLMSYLCSLVNYGFFANCYYYLVFFVLFFFFDFGVYYEFLYLEVNFFFLCYDVNYLFVFWIIFVLLALLCFISFSVDNGCCLRGL